MVGQPRGLPLRGSRPLCPLDIFLRERGKPRWLSKLLQGRVLLICRRVFREYVHPPGPLRKRRGEVYTPLRAGEGGMRVVGLVGVCSGLFCSDFSCGSACSRLCFV